MSKSPPKTPIAFSVCYKGLDVEGQKIPQLYGHQLRYRSTESNCEWTELPVTLYPHKITKFSVDADGEYEVQSRQIRHSVILSGLQEVLSTTPGEWSESTVVTAEGAPPIRLEPPRAILFPGCVA